MLLDMPSSLDHYHQVHWAQGRLVISMYSPGKWHEHILWSYRALRMNHVYTKQDYLDWTKLLLSHVDLLQTDSYRYNKSGPNEQRSHEIIKRG